MKFNNFLHSAKMLNKKIKIRILKISDEKLISRRNVKISRQIYGIRRIRKKHSEAIHCLYASNSTLW